MSVNEVEPLDHQTIFTLGIQRYAETHHISIEVATQQLRQIEIDRGSDEHLLHLDRALQYLLSQKTQE